MSEPQRTPLADTSELLLRQVHPQFQQPGTISSQAFEPNKADAGFLSVDREALTTPAQSHEAYTTGLGLKSCGVYAVSVEEVVAQELQALSDPLEAQEGKPANPAHALIDFSLHTGNKRKMIAQRLRDRAVRRGRLWPK